MNKSFQQGQTLIETVVAIFIMVMGITAALGLASYSLGASTSIRKQIVGIGLAREGMEAVKNMRDTNWLNGELSTNCHNYEDLTTTGACYRDWLNPVSGTGYDFRMTPLLPGVPREYRLTFDGTADSSNDFWSLDFPDPGSPGGFELADPWGLFLTDGDPGLGFYVPSGVVPGILEHSGFYRKITITPDVTRPFNQQTFSLAQHDWPRLLVTTQVWWTDKKCPEITDWPGENMCSIQLQTYLTNWKNY